MRVLEVSNRPGFGGVGIYVNYLTAELARRSVEVGWFYSGEYDTRVSPYVKESVRENKVQVFAFRNSPNVHAAYAHVHPKHEMRHPVIEGHFRNVLLAYRPQVVHFHDFGGLCSSLIEVAHDLSILTVNSHHSYWFICPKNDLIFTPTQEICPGPDEGRNCSQCLSPSPRQVFMARSFAMAKSTIVARMLKPTAARLLHAHRRRRAAKARHSLAPRPAAHAELVPFYGERERYNLWLLSQRVTLNIAVSSFVKARFEEWGVPPEKFVVQHIGTRAAEFLKPFPHEDRTPVTFGFLGPLNPHKGAHTLVEAFSRLGSSLPARLLVYGDNGQEYANALRRKSEKSSVEFRPSYRYEDLQNILSEMDFVVVPPIWYDNAPQVVFEALSAGVPVIASKIGGIPDFVKDGENGMLFEAGNSEELAAKMERVARDPSLIRSLRVRVKPTKTMSEHVGELLPLYVSLCDRPVLAKT